MQRAKIVGAVLLALVCVAAWPSGYQRTDDRYQDLLTKVRDATYLTGKYWGNAGFQFATGNRLSPDSLFHQNGPSKDGFVPPARAAGPAK
jgi:hypothetical protein